MKITKLRHQFYIFQILLTFILFLFLGFTYCFYEIQYKKDVESSIISKAKAAKINMEPIKPRGKDFAGSLASSAAKGTPSTAKKNQIAYGTAAQIPI